MCQLVAAVKSKFGVKLNGFSNGRSSIALDEFEKFYPIVQRSLKSGGEIVLFGYTFLNINSAIDKLLYQFFKDLLGKYWNLERRLVEQEYQTLPFPFQELSSPKFYYKTQWTFNHLIGYLNTWSATQHYLKENGKNPVELGCV